MIYIYFFFQLHLNVSEHGLTLETGIYICKINPGSLAAKEGTLAVGDRVLSVSWKSLCIFVQLLSGQSVLNYLLINVLILCFRLITNPWMDSKVPEKQWQSWMRHVTS